MKKRFIQFVAAALVVVLCVPSAWAVTRNKKDEIMIRVGLASSSKHNAVGVLSAAHLQNNTGYGSGFRFGYYDGNLNFVELGRTDESITDVAVLKTQNLYYGYVSSAGKYTYSDSITSSIAVGCYHIQITGSYTNFNAARTKAESCGGFVAWINGAYKVRVGAYLTKEEAQSALSKLGSGTIVGTSSYGMSVVKNGTNQVLFQYDNTQSPTFAVLPDVTGKTDVRTWFSGYKYRGGFTYQRIGGSGVTVVNVLPLEDYIRGVVCYEMGRSWPVEALKAQAICARTYAINYQNHHKDLGFDVCDSDACQVYRGVGSNRTDYGPTDVSDKAVAETAGQVLWYSDHLAETYYASSNGGASESASYIWGTNMTKYPYLCGVIDPYEKEAASVNPYSSWKVEYTAAQLISRLQSYGYGTGTTIKKLDLTYSELGNVIKVKVDYNNGQSNTFTPRTSPGMISLFGLRSLRFTVNGVDSGIDTSGTYIVNETEKLIGLAGTYVIAGTGTVEKAGTSLYAISGTGETSKLVVASSLSGTTKTVSVSGSKYTFDGSGWGHQIGMSQYGAYAMARLGFDGKGIVEFYFPGTNVAAYH